MSDLDPDIASLLDDASSGAPDFNTLMGIAGGGDDNGGEVIASNTQDPDSSQSGSLSIQETFPEITAYEQDPVNYFADKDFYKSLLTGEGEVSQSIHKNLAKFLKAEDPQDKTAFRNRLIGQFWELGRKISAKSGSQLPKPKQLLLRFGVLLPTLLDKDQRLTLGKVVNGNATAQPIHYVDEWLKNIALGDIAGSASDEVTAGKRKGSSAKAKMMMEKARGNKDSNKQIIETKQMEILQLENRLVDQIKIVKDHEKNVRFGDLINPYTGLQRKALNTIVNTVKELIRQDRDVSLCFHKLEKAEEDLEKVKQQLEEMGEDVTVDLSTITKEFDNIRQMAKMCVGRQGNQFPILFKQFAPSSIQMMATRENVIKVLREIERLDPELFFRTFKQQTNRIVPYIILIPCYGDKGICWEPFDRFNRATSRGRIAIPMYPKDIFTAVLYAVADLRWQVAKEKAAHYWMEEGLTGHYYQWFSDKKMKGDVRLRFIEDYFLWITKESEGMQKLDKEVRGIFWRNMPFPQDVKDNLRNRGFAYSELYKKDVNRSLSSGY